MDNPSAVQPLSSITKGKISSEHRNYENISRKCTFSYKKNTQKIISEKPIFIRCTLLDKRFFCGIPGQNRQAGGGILSDSRGVQQYTKKRRVVQTKPNPKNLNDHFYPKGPLLRKSQPCNFN
jgi:hypothetical protein